MTTYDVVQKLEDMGLLKVNEYYYSFDYKLMISVYHKQGEVRINRNTNSGKFYTPENAILAIQEYLMDIVDPPVQQYYWEVLGRKVKAGGSL